LKQKPLPQSNVASGPHALVFGASGLAGWAAVDRLLYNYPAERTFSKVKVLVDRPLDVSESYWPSHSSVAFDLLSNVNLMEGTVENFIALLKRKVEGIANVTHVPYFGTFDEEPILHVYVHVFALTRPISACK
jgi:hypothetical protein